MNSWLEELLPKRMRSQLEIRHEFIMLSEGGNANECEFRDWRTEGHQNNTKVSPKILTELEKTMR